MGTYSDVAVATTMKGYEHIIEKATSLAAERGVRYPLIGIDAIGQTCVPDIFEEEDCCIVFGWECVKFAGYEGWDYVDAVRDAIEDARECGHPVEVAIAVPETGYIEAPDYQDGLSLHVEIMVSTNIYK